MKYIDMSIVYWFYSFFIILEIKVALINYSLSNATSKAAGNNGLIGLIRPHTAPCGQYPSQSGVWANQMTVIKEYLPVVVGMTVQFIYWKHAPMDHSPDKNLCRKCLFGGESSQYHYSPHNSR